MTNRCAKCFPLGDAIKLYSEAKSYDRAPVNYAVRTELEYPSAPEQLAIRLPPRVQEVKVKKQTPVYVGREVPVDSLIKRTKSGEINTQSTLGKTVALALEHGCEVRAWASEVANGIAGAHHGLRFTVVGASVMLNGKPAKKEELYMAIESAGAE